MAPELPGASAGFVSPHRHHPRGGWAHGGDRDGTHTGSHLDAPLHKIAGGKSINRFAAGNFASRAPRDLRSLAPDTTDRAGTARTPAARARAGDIVLLATGWGDRRAKTDEWLHHAPVVDPPARAGSSSAACAAWASFTIIRFGRLCLAVSQPE